MLVARVNFLITGDAPLRSAVAAALGIAGITVITADSCRGLRRVSGQRCTGILIIDDALSDADPVAWVESLRQRWQDARIILLTDDPSRGWGDDITFVSKNSAAPAILALIERWQRPRGR